MKAEAETGRLVITAQNIADFHKLVMDIVEDAAALLEPTEEKAPAIKR